MTRDFADAGIVVRRPETLTGWLRAYAAATATTATWETIRDAATPRSATKPARSTSIGYSDVLTELRILDPIPAWSPSRNHLARLAASPKHHLADPALAVRLLRRDHTQLLRGDERWLPIPRDGKLLGALFESLAALSVRTYAERADANVSHMRTSGGHREIDFILERNGAVLAIEAKLAGNVDDHDVRHLVWLRKQLGDDLVDAMIITTGQHAHRRRDGIAVVPLALLGP